MCAKQAIPCPLRCFSTLTYKIEFSLLQRCQVLLRALLQLLLQLRPVLGLVANAGIETPDFCQSEVYGCSTLPQLAHQCSLLDTTSKSSTGEFYLFVTRIAALTLRISRELIITSSCLRHHRLYSGCAGTQRCILSTRDLSPSAQGSRRTLQIGRTYSSGPKRLCQKPAAPPL